MSKKKLSWLLDSWAYRKAKGLVSATLNSPERLLELVASAQALKALSTKRFSEILEPVKAAFRLVKCYAKGEYRDISVRSISLIVTSMIYFVMPLDALPDFIVALGFADDAALLTWTLKAVSEDLERFIYWEKHEASVIDAEYDVIESD